MSDSVLALAKKYEPYVIETRHWLHQHAELGWQEYETTEFIAAQLRDMGLEPKRFDEEHTGLYAMIQGGKATESSRTILLRADIDALPTVEKTGLPYASIHEGVMHACGHDTHAAMLLGAARILTDMRDELAGNVKLFFQAAEETAIGAKWFVDQGVTDDVDAAYACHITSWLDAPCISVSEGPRTAACDEFKLTISGTACHGGMPHQGNDAIVAASSVVMNLQTIVSRMTDSLDALVITVGTMNGGFNYNVVSDQVVMTGTVRSYSREVRSTVAQKMEAIAQATAQAFGCTAKLEYEYKTPAIIHDDAQMNRIAREAAVKLFGEKILLETRPIGGGDDFGYLGEKVPRIFAFIGGRNEALDCIYGHHHPNFQVDESSFLRGSAMYAQVAVDYLADTQ